MQPTRIKPLAIHESFGILHHRHLRKLYPILEVLNSTTDGNSECNKYSVPKTRTVPGATTASFALPRHPNAFINGSALLSLISLVSSESVTAAPPLLNFADVPACARCSRGRCSCEDGAMLPRHPGNGLMVTFWTRFDTLFLRGCGLGMAYCTGWIY